MFDIGASELLLVVVIAIVVIGPKDLPLALGTAGRWLGKVRRVSGHVRSGFETLIREAELEEANRKHNTRDAALAPPPRDRQAGDPPASIDKELRPAAQRPPLGNGIQGA